MKRVSISNERQSGYGGEESCLRRGERLGTKNEKLENVGV